MSKAIIFFSGSFVGALFGWAWTLQTVYSDPTNECRRENNVYQCKLIAVPVVSPRTTGEGR